MYSTSLSISKFYTSHFAVFGIRHISLFSVFLRKPWRTSLFQMLILHKCKDNATSYQYNEAISEFSSASVSKRVYVRNLSYENEFCIQFHFHVNQSHFSQNSFALRLAMKQRHKGTRQCLLILQHNRLCLPMTFQ